MLVTSPQIIAEIVEVLESPRISKKYLIRQKDVAKLQTDRGRDRYPDITCHRAPHKPFLLLSVMDLIAEGRVTHNFIEPFHKVLCRWARP